MASSTKESRENVILFLKWLFIGLFLGSFFTFTGIFIKEYVMDEALASLEENKK